MKYMEEQGIQNALSLALAQVIREQPPNALKRIAQIISPDTFIDPEAVAALRELPTRLRHSLVRPSWRDYRREGGVFCGTAHLGATFSKQPRETCASCLM